MQTVRFYYSAPVVTATVAMIETSEFDPDAVLGFWSTSRKPLPRITICAVFNEKDSTLSFGAALCSAKDRFIKKVGREIAEQRARTNPMKVVPVTTENVVSIRMQTFEEIEEMIWEMNPKKF